MQARGRRPAERVVPAGSRRDGGVASSGARERQSGLFTVLVQRAESVPTRGGYVDAFVKVNVAGREARTQLSRRTANPQWRETLEFSGALGDFLGPMSISPPATRALP